MMLRGVSQARGEQDGYCQCVGELVGRARSPCHQA